VIRAFIDGLVSRSETSKEVLKQYGNRIHDSWRDYVPILHMAAREGNAQIIGFLFDGLKAAGYTHTQ
jgi:hypothetical protein